MRFPNARLVLSACQHIGKHNRIHGSHDDHTGINRRACVRVDAIHARRQPNRRAIFALLLQFATLAQTEGKA